MSGMYGTIKPADIDIDNDVEVFYSYRSSYNMNDNENNSFIKINNPSSVLYKSTTRDNKEISGLFNLKLKMDIFNRKGIYTVYIRPKELDATISDIGTLAAFPDVRGVVFSSDNFNEIFKMENGMVGYRIEYLEGGKKTGNFKIITSSNKVNVTSYLLNNSTERGTKYYYSMDGTEIFCTVTPSLAPTFLPNSLPLLGKAGESVKIVNTKFNPIMIEIEIVEHDDETIAYMLEGNQLIDKDNAIITTYNDNGEIYHQSEYGVYKDEYGNPLYEFKKKKDNIDFNQSLSNLE